MKRLVIALFAGAGVLASVGAALAGGSGCLNTSARLDGAETLSTPAPAAPRPADAG